MQAKKKQAFLSSSPNVLSRLKFALWNNKQANFIKSRLFLFRNLQHLMSLPRLFGHAGSELTPLNSACYHNLPANTAVFPCFSPQGTGRFAGKWRGETGRIRGLYQLKNWWLSGRHFAKSKKEFLLRRPRGRGVLRRGWSKDFFGFEILYSGIFLGRKIWQVYFWVA